MFSYFSVKFVEAMACSIPGKDIITLLFFSVLSCLVVRNYITLSVLLFAFLYILNKSCKSNSNLQLQLYDSIKSEIVPYSKILLVEGNVHLREILEKKLFAHVDIISKDFKGYKAVGGKDREKAKKVAIYDGYHINLTEKYDYVLLDNVINEKKNPVLFIKELEKVVNRKVLVIENVKNNLKDQLFLCIYSLYYQRDPICINCFLPEQVWVESLKKYFDYQKTINLPNEFLNKKLLILEKRENEK